MSEVVTTAVIRQLAAVLLEALEGPPNPWSYFTDRGAEAGLFGTIAALSAADASRPVAGTAIAGHVFHAAWAMNRSAVWIRGERTPRDWRESWKVRAVDDAAWAEVREELRRGYADLREAVDSLASADEPALGAAIGALAHVACHLGAIRQKAAVLRAAPQ